MITEKSVTPCMAIMACQRRPRRRCESDSIPQDVLDEDAETVLSCGQDVDLRDIVGDFALEIKRESWLLRWQRGLDAEIAKGKGP